MECDSQDRGTRIAFEDTQSSTYNPVFISESLTREPAKQDIQDTELKALPTSCNMEFLSKGGRPEELKAELQGLERTALKSQR